MLKTVCCEWTVTPTTSHILWNSLPKQTGLFPSFGLYQQVKIIYSFGIDPQQLSLTFLPNYFLLLELGVCIGLYLSPHSKKLKNTHIFCLFSQPDLSIFSAIRFIQISQSWRTGDIMPQSPPTEEAAFSLGELTSTDWRSVVTLRDLQAFLGGQQAYS